MAQFLRPSSTNSAGLWTATGAATLHEAMDDVTKDDDTTYGASSSNPVADEVILELSDGTDPASSTGHIIRAWVRKDAAAGKTIDVTIFLYQNLSIVASVLALNIGSTYQLVQYTLSGAEADSITNYTDLQISAMASATGGGAARVCRCTMMEMEIPSVTHTGAISIGGVAALVMAATVIATHLGAAVLAGIGSVTLAGTKIDSPTVTTAGVATLTLAGTVVEPTTKYGAMNISGVASLSCTVVGSVYGAVAFGDVASLVMEGTVPATHEGAIVIDGAAALVMTGDTVSAGPYPTAASLGWVSLINVGGQVAGVDPAVAYTVIANDDLIVAKPGKVALADAWRNNDEILGNYCFYLAIPEFQFTGNNFAGAYFFNVHIPSASRELRIPLQIRTGGAGQAEIFAEYRDGLAVFTSQTEVTTSGTYVDVELVIDLNSALRGYDILTLLPRPQPQIGEILLKVRNANGATIFARKVGANDIKVHPLVVTDGNNNIVQPKTIRDLAYHITEASDYGVGQPVSPILLQEWIQNDREMAGIIDITPTTGPLIATAATASYVATPTVRVWVPPFASRVVAMCSVDQAPKGGGPFQAAGVRITLGSVVSPEQVIQGSTGDPAILEVDWPWWIILEGIEALRDTVVNFFWEVRSISGATAKKITIGTSGGAFGDIRVPVGLVFLPPASL